MPTQLDDNEFLMKCACGDRLGHVAWLIYEPEESRSANLKGCEDDWYLMTSLDHRFGFWKRLWTGLRYVFKPTRLHYHGYAELVLRNEDADALAAFIIKKRMGK